MIVEIAEEYDDLLNSLEWDDYEIAYYEEQVVDPTTIEDEGFVRPILAELAGRAAETIAGMVREDEDGTRKIIADDSVDHEEIAIQGSTAVVPGAAPRAVVQYTIVFDDPDQQKRWYEFIRWLRNEPGYEGSTTGEKLVSYIDAHSEA